LAGNWDGFEGRDDRYLFEEGRPHILIRLHVRLSYYTLGPDS
jgi:hypothetical protein